MSIKKFARKMERNKFVKIVLSLTGLILVSGTIYYGFFGLSGGQDVENAEAADLDDSYIPNLVVNCGTVNVLDGVTLCSFDLPADTTFPSAFKIGIGDSTPVSASCVTAGIDNRRVVCTDVPVGSEGGIQSIHAQINSGTKTDTGSDVYIEGNVNIGNAKFYFDPEQGPAAPLFKSVDNINVTVKDFITESDDTPEVGEYVCRIEVREMADQEAPEPPNYIILGDDISYDPVDGCDAVIPKDTRGRKLNWSLRATITQVSDPSKVYYFYDNYIFRFEGAGVSFGG